MNKILKNICWLLFDKIFILILQFFIGVKVANYYGSESFGIYNYAVTIVTFSNIFFELFNNRVIKKYFTNNKFNFIVFNVNFFRNILAIFLFVITMILGKYTVTDNLFYYTLLLLCLDNILLVSTSGIENYFEYKLNSKNIVLINNFVKLISYLGQYIGIILNFSIIVVPITRCFGSIIRIIVLNYFYKKTYLNKEKIREKVDISLIKNIIKDSFYLWITYVAFIIYTQIDKVMLGKILGVKEVGVYSIAIQLTQFLGILIFPIQTSLFPKMLELYKNSNEEEYRKFYLLSNNMITQLYIFGYFISILCVKFLFLKIFSIEYIEVIELYNILGIVVVFKANGALQTGHMTIKNITKKSIYKTFLGLIINIILNSFLIRKYGMSGAATATLISQMTALFIVDFFIKEYKEQAFIQLKSFNSIYLIKNMGTILNKRGENYE